MKKSLFKTAIVIICLLIGWGVASSGGFAISVCCPDIVDLCRISHPATVNASHGPGPCMPSHHPSHGKAHHEPPVLAAEGHQDDVSCCEASPCLNAGTTPAVAPSQPEPLSLTALGATFEPAVVNIDPCDTAAFTAPVPSSIPLYLQKNALIC